jgi:hypothetical protein
MLVKNKSHKMDKAKVRDKSNKKSKTAKGRGGNRSRRNVRIAKGLEKRRHGNR